MMTTETKPCPFCGSESVAVQPGSTFRWVFAECMECGASTGEERVQTSGSGTPAEWAADAEARAMAEWNRRTEVTTPPAASGAATALPSHSDLAHRLSVIAHTLSYNDGGREACAKHDLLQLVAALGGTGEVAALASREAQHSPAPLTDEQIMDTVRDLAADGGRWPSDWIEAVRRCTALASPQVAPAPESAELPMVTWWTGTKSHATKLAESLDRYAKIKPGADHDIWCMRAAAKWIREVVALAAPVQVAPIGWKLVLIEPTEEMMRAGLGAEQFGRRAAYQQMLSAVPVVPVQEATPASLNFTGGVNKIVEEFVEDYEMRGEDAEGRDCDYTPNETEKLLILDAIWGLLSHDEFLSALVAPMQPGAAADDARDAATFLQPADYAALARVGECLEDDEGYDVPAETMKRLAELGVVRRRTGSIYSVTSFGSWLLGTWEVLPLQTTSDANVPPSTPAAKPAEEQGS